MNNENAGAPLNPPQPPSPKSAFTSVPSAPGTHRLFRPVDWLAFLVTFAAVWLGYYLTLAPELTLEDSGELATGSFYAGIPHPPGYPVWTIYTWIWTVLLPFKNIAWRVALGEATSGAFAAGLLGLLVSRGSSLLIEGVEELKAISAAWERRICLVSGFVGGMLIGFNGFMWSQSVIVEVYSFGVASFMIVLVFLLRWIYAPSQRRYLYLALFFHGICFTNHQTLVVAAIGLEVAIAAADFRMGRSLWLGNSIIYLAGLILKFNHILTALENNQAIFVIFNVVGVLSIIAYIWFCILTKETGVEFGLDGCLAALVISLALALAHKPAFLALSLAAVGGIVYLALQTRKLGREWLVVIGLGVCWIVGASFYFYMPLAGMTNPPMQWGYPRTVEGFIHAFTRGQYEKANPTDIFGDPKRFITQLGMLGTGIIEEFNWVYALLALVPFLFFFKLHKRERAWFIGLAVIYLCLGVLLLILLNPPPDRAAQSLVRVFFTASHTVIAMLVGYGLTLVAAYMAAHYQSFRSWGLIGGGVAIALALYSLASSMEAAYFGEGSNAGLSALLPVMRDAFTSGDQYGLPVFAGFLLILLSALFVGAVWYHRERAPLGLALAVFACMPFYSILTHWSDNEQRDHWFGYWFGHDMFSPPFKGSNQQPLYPSMTKDAVLFGGTDPGRFCPTYMIFCDSFLPRNCQPVQDPNFDRRDVYIITQNALADATYLSYIRAHYNRSTQIDPPFFQELLRSADERIANDRTNALARAVKPLDRFFTGLGDSIEKKRRTFTSWFSAKDFTNFPALAARLKPGPQQDSVSKFLYENLTPDTRKEVQQSSDSANLRQQVERDLNRILEQELAGKPALYDPERFRQVKISEYLQDFIKQNPRGHTRVRLNRLLLEAAYPQEIAHSLGGVYPDREIHTPTPDELSKCYNDYVTDAGRRYQLNQLKPGEDVKVDGSGRLSISGQVAVMAINGLLTKVIFDQNPKNEFFVEESFPLDWMYPHLTPYGIIMKINRQPLPELTQEIVSRDHQFWSEYSGRLIGNWINYDTPVKEITDWVQKTYLRRNFSGFTGDRKFVRDDQAQKSFSKLRSALAGVYLWRLSGSKPGTPQHERMLKETDFAFKQSFAFCPYSPEAVFRYATHFLVPQQRIDDAILVAATCLKLDPYNSSVKDLLQQLEAFKKQQAQLNPAQLEKALRENPQDLQRAFNLAGTYLQTAQTGKAIEVLDAVLNRPGLDFIPLYSLLQAFHSLNATQQLQQVMDRLQTLYKSSPTNLLAGTALAEGYRDQGKHELALQTLDEVLNSPQLDPQTALQLANQYAQLGAYPRLESTLQKLVTLAPSTPEAWFDLAAIKAALGKPAECFPNLRKALELNDARLRADPKAKNLRIELQADPRFQNVRNMAEFKQLAGEK